MTNGVAIAELVLMIFGCLLLAAIAAMFLYMIMMRD